MRGKNFVIGRANNERLLVGAEVLSNRESAQAIARVVQIFRLSGFVEESAVRLLAADQNVFLKRRSIEEQLVDFDC